MIVLHVILWVFLALLGLLLLLLFSPLHLSFSYSEEGALLRVRLLFFRYQLLPEKPKHARKKKPKKELEQKEKSPETEKKSQLKGILKKAGELELSGVLELMKQAASLAGGLWKRFYRRLNVRSLNLRIVVAGEDASETALQYGYTCGVVSTAMGVLLNTAKYRKYSVSVLPDFDASESSASVSFEVSVLPVFLLAAGAGFIKGFAVLRQEFERMAPTRKE